jgi:MFS family permease
MKLDPEVRALGFVSLLNDVGSEMIYPILPAFLISALGASPMALGAIEGAAEAAASVFKTAFGFLSDRRDRKLFVVVGYALSAASRPLLALARSSPAVLLVRLLDRGGKGVRTAPRDALVAQATDPSSLGRAFGYQRAMDNLGAVVGPLAGALALSRLGSPQAVFLVAVVPGVLATLTVQLFVKNRPPQAPRASDAGTAALPREFLAYLVVVAIFTLGNSSDTFLLLRAEEEVPLGGVAVLWALHNLVKAVLSAPLGALSDRIGRRVSIGVGWGIYALTYAGFASGRVPIGVLFAFYALHYSFSEGPERALVAELTGGHRGGRAFGIYHGVTGALLLPASLLTGALWTRYGAPAALFTGAGLAGIAALGLLLLVPERTPQT